MTMKGEWRFARRRAGLIAAIALAVPLLAALPAAAQAPSARPATFAAMPFATAVPGEHVTTDRVPAASLARPRSIATLQEDRQSDSVLDGALIGAGAAIAGGLLLCTRTEPWRNCRDDVGPMVRIGAVGAGIGIAIDALIRRERRAPDADAARLRLAPVVARNVRGLQVSVGF